MNESGAFLAALIRSAAKAYAAGAVARQLELQPDVFERYGTAGFQDLAGDTEVRLTYLAEALAAGRPKVLEDQVAWQKVAMTARDIPVECLRVNLGCLRDELSEGLPAASSAMAVEYLDGALSHLDAAPAELPSLLAEDHPQVELTRRYLLAVLEGRRGDALDLVLQARRDGLSVSVIQTEVVARAQAEIGRMWQMAEIHAGEEHFGTEIARQALAQLRIDMPRAASLGRRVVCAAVGGDLHSIGLEMVSDHLEMAGWQSILLGQSMPAPDLILAVRDFSADLLALSVSLATQTSATAALIHAIRTHGGSGIPIMVGGAPFRSIPDLWEVVGADGCAPDAVRSVAVANRLVRQGPARDER